MILIKTTSETKPSDLILVAQNPSTYELLGFSVTGAAFDYDTDHTLFEGNGRYKVRDGSLPATELGLRTEFFTLHRDSQLIIAKAKRDADKVALITVTLDLIDYEFDLDEDAQKNINNTVNDFTAAQDAAVALGWPLDGTLPWVLANNETLAVTFLDLKEVVSAGVARGMTAHMTYGVTRAALEALIPVV